MSTLLMHVGYAAMKYAMDSASDGPRFQVEQFTQRVGPLAGDHHEAEADEVVYVLGGTGCMSVEGESYELRPGVAIFVAGGQSLSATGDARGVSVLIHEPEPSSGHAVLDLDEMETGSATAAASSCSARPPRSAARQVTQFVGLRPARPRARPLPTPTTR